MSALPGALLTTRHVACTSILSRFPEEWKAELSRAVLGLVQGAQKCSCPPLSVCVVLGVPGPRPSGKGGPSRSPGRKGPKPSSCIFSPRGPQASWRPPSPGRESIHRRPLGGRRALCSLRTTPCARHPGERLSEASSPSSLCAEPLGPPLTRAQLGCAGATWLQAGASELGRSDCLSVFCWGEHVQPHTLACAGVAPCRPHSSTPLGLGESPAGVPAQQLPAVQTNTLLSCPAATPHAGNPVIAPWGDFGAPPLSFRSASLRRERRCSPKAWTASCPPGLTWCKGNVARWGAVGLPHSLLRPRPEGGGARLRSQHVGG